MKNVHCQDNVTKLLAYLIYFMLKKQYNIVGITLKMFHTKMNMKYIWNMLNLFILNNNI